GKALLEVAGAAVQMGLKHGDDPPILPSLVRRLERGHDLGRMMRVVVDHEDVVDLADLVKAPLYARKLGQPGANLLEIDVQLEGHGQGRQRIPNVVQPGCLQLDVSE